MRFAESGYYIEQYIKCDNCGVLIYREALKSAEPEHADLVFCTEWCIAWHAKKTAGDAMPLVELEFDH